MAEHKNLYERALYYDIALSRDVTPELNFAEAVYGKHRQQPLSSLLEIACGPGYHTIEAATRGIRAVGLDLMPQMIDYAREKALFAGVTPEFIVADMRHFTLSAPVDMAICTFDSLDALTNYDDVIAHLQSVADNLTQDGLYLLHFTHPRESSLTHYGEYSYHGTRDGITVDIYWGTNQPVFDIVTSTAHVDIEIHIDDHGEQKIIHDTADEHLFTPQEIQLLTRLSGVFTIAAWYGDYNINQPFDHSPQAQFMIVILQKQRNT